MKKIIAMLLVLVMTLALVACGATTETPATTATPATEAATEAATEEATEAATEGEVAVMTYEEYMAAEMDSAVTVECYVQATQSWWDNKITVYAQDPDGAYFMYNMTCAEEDAAKLTTGTKIKVKGFKAEYKGEVEIIDCTFEVMEGTWTAEATDVTALLASEDIINHQNKLVAIKGAKIVASKNAAGEEAAFLYNWDGSGEAGNDLYFNIEVEGNTYNMCVESYLTGDGTAAYDAVEALAIGDTVDLEGFLYWYDGVNPHITGVTKAA